MEDILERNIPTISASKQQLLKKSTVAVVGCGGLGGFVCEYLVRAGIGNIIAIDGDTFCTANFNRQLLATEATLGQNKAVAAMEYAKKITPLIVFTAHAVNLSKNNCRELLSGADLVIDALDSANARIMLEEICNELNLTMIHGAINGLMLQVAVIKPGRELMKKLYAQKTSEPSSTLSFVPGICAGIEVSEAVRILSGEEPLLAESILIGDLDLMTFETVKI